MFSAVDKIDNEFLSNNFFKPKYRESIYNI